MQYLVKLIMVSVSSGVIGAFAGMYLKFTNQMMKHGEPVLGMVLFFAGLGAMFLYSFLLKKFVMGKELSIAIPNICLALSAWLSFQYYVVS